MCTRAHMSACTHVCMCIHACRYANTHMCMHVPLCECVCDIMTATALDSSDLHLLNMLLFVLVTL